MFCEAYDKPLSDAAASSEPLSRELEQHLASCDSCHAAFAEEQSLFTAIDSCLHAAANSGVPATLIPRAHVALNNEPLPQRGSRKWILVTAALTCALVVAVALQLRYSGAPVHVKTTTAQTSTAPSPRQKNSFSSALRAAHEIPRRSNRAETTQSRLAHSDSSITAEVLVPDEERVAFAKFVTHEQKPSVQFSAALSLVPAAPKELVPIPPVEIASLEVLPLNGEEGSRREF